MSWNERTQVILVTNGSYTWTTTTRGLRASCTSTLAPGLSTDKQGMPALATRGAHTTATAQKQHAPSGRDPPPFLHRR